MVAALFLPRGSLPVDAWEIGRIGVGRWRGHGSEPGGLAAEEVLVVRGPGGWEVQCHGGNAAAAAVVADLVRLGAERVPSGAWHTDSAPTVAAEALSLLAAVDAPRGARILCRQLAGALDHELAEIAALVGRGQAGSARRRADRLRRAARVGLRLAEPWRVVVSGRVNAGKSSLVNALAGHARSLVSPRPGTTRDVIETAVVFSGWSVVLVDTAGLRDRDSEASGATERAGIARARAAAAAADLVVEVVEVGEPVPAPAGLVVWSKADLWPGVVVPAGVIATSSRSGAGILDLVAAVIAQLVPEAEEPGLLDGAVAFLPRHLELIDRLVGAESAGESPAIGESQ
ncbi:MAG: tRNA modification GTPase MnmE [Planctomycetota bacterium]